MKTSPKFQKIQGTEEHIEKHHWTNDLVALENKWRGDTPLLDLKKWGKRGE